MGYEIMNTARDVVPRRRVEEAAFDLVAAKRRLLMGGAGEVDLLTGKDERQERIFVLCEEARDILSVHQRIYPLEVLHRLHPHSVKLIRAGITSHTFYDTRNLSREVLEWLTTMEEPAYCCYGPVQVKILDGARLLIDGPIIDGVESVVHTTDATLVAAARRYVGAVRATAIFCEEFLERQRIANPEPGDLGERLTERQRRVAELLDLGVLDDEIARELGVSLRTVGSEVAAIMQALGARNRFGAGRRYAALKA